jgi:hypothetical protein
MSSNKSKKMNSKKGHENAAELTVGINAASVGINAVGINAAHENAAELSVGINAANAHENVAELSVGINAANDNVAELSVVIANENVSILDIAEAITENGGENFVLDTPQPLVSRRVQTPFYGGEITLFSETTCSSGIL